MYTVLVLFVACLVGSGTAQRQTVPELDAASYVGRWYQTYTNLWSDIFANLPNPECATADYGALNATYISVRNSNYYTSTKERRVIEGVAWIPSLDEPGKLKLSLDGVPVIGDYWIFKLGPIVNGVYEYSLITDSDDRQLFVLARDVAVFLDQYDDEVREYLALVGFTGNLKQPIVVSHPKDCVYLDPQ